MAPVIDDRQRRQDQHQKFLAAPTPAHSSGFNNFGAVR
jgi:hypothetical protein